MIGALVAGVTGSGGASLSSYESIATFTATGGETSASFTSIPSTFKHLQIRGIDRVTDIGTSFSTLYLRFNSDTGTNYSYHELLGTGAAASAGGAANETVIQSAYAPRDGHSAGIFGASIIDILDYTSTSKYKTVRSFFGADTNGAGRIYVSSGSWRSTSAITSINLDALGDSLKAGTTFALYGIKEA